MIDLDRLFSGSLATGGNSLDTEQKERGTGPKSPPDKALMVAARDETGAEVVASVATCSRSEMDEVATREPAWIKASGEMLPLLPVLPPQFHGREEETTPRDPVEGAAGREFALDFSAIALLLAWHGKARGSTDKAILMDLSRLKTMEPEEQVRYWHGRCMERNLKPWMILARPASLDGMDCTFCKHLTTRKYANRGERRRFDWACGLGYLILETGRGTEWIWIAPPECHSYERWVPGSGRPVVYQFLGND